jgi:hypothetical protein
MFSINKIRHHLPNTTPKCLAQCIAVFIDSSNLSIITYFHYYRTKITENLNKFLTPHKIKQVTNNTDTFFLKLVAFLNV